MSADFQLVVPLARLTNQPQPYHVEAGPEARAEIAQRFDLLALESLGAELLVAREGEGAHVTGTLKASVVQACVVSGDSVPARIDQPITLRFEPAPAEGEIELDPDALDTMHVEGNAVDLAEAVAQSLFLALEPYPRAPDEQLARVRAHLLSEDEAEARATAAKAAANPFAALRRP